MIDTQKYMRCVRKHLKDTGQIQKVDELVLMMLEMEIETYAAQQDFIAKNPYTVNRFGRKEPTNDEKLNRSHKRLMDCIRQLGLSPAARDKMKQDQDTAMPDFMKFLNDDSED